LCATHHEITHPASYVSLSRCPSLLPSPMGRLLTRFPRLSLAQLRLSLRSTTVCTCRRVPCTLPHCSSRSPSCETHLLLIICRGVAVSMSSPAQSPFRLPPSTGTPPGRAVVVVSMSTRQSPFRLPPSTGTPPGRAVVVVSMSTRSREAQSQSSTAECIPTKLLAAMYVPATPAKPRPIALFHMFRACARRVAVSMSYTAQSRLGLP
jgi:hypothetical protein